MQNGSSGRPTGVCTGDATEGRPGLSEPEGGAARIARERQPGARTNGLAAAIAEIKELYERECAGLMEPVDALERDHDLPRQRTDNPEPEWDAARMEADGARTRAARAVAALASEHEERLAAEVELDRLRTEAEGERERTREALQQAKTAGERWQRAEAEVIRLRREIEVRHHQAEEEHARLVEEADGLGQRLQAAERDAAQLREEESARQSFGRWAWLSAATTSVLLGVAVAVLSAWLLFPEPAKDRIISAAATIQTSWVAAKEAVFGKLQPTTTPVPQPSVPNLGAGQPRALAATPIDSRPEQIQMLSQVGSTFSEQQDRGDSSQSRPQISGNQQQSTLAAPVQDKVPEANFAPPSVSAAALSEASDSVPQKQQTDATQENAQGKGAPPQPEPTSITDKVTPSPQRSRQPTIPISPPTNETTAERKLVTDRVAAHVSIHYRQGSPSGRADAERVATWLVSSGFGTSQLFGSQHAPGAQVVRYFFVEDTEAASRIVRELRKRGGRWRAEDCTHYRHKPPAGSIQVWPIKIP